MNMKAGLQTMGVLRPNDPPAAEPVALETTVLVNGARPGDNSAQRRLFSEEVQTVLVFERGAVIRLSAAVADGQLLFLTNKSTGKEVVAQVLRKRAFRPTTCYVDLEFTEPCPGFWGIEFPANGGGATTAQKAEVGGDFEGEPLKPASPPSTAEVERLKQEVAALQQKLQSLKESAPKEPDRVAQPLAAGPKSASDAASEIARREERQLQELLAIEIQQEVAAGPKRLVSYPQRATKVDQPKGRGIKVAGLILLLLTACGLSAYQFGALDSLLRKPAPAKPASAASAANDPLPARPPEAKPAANNSPTNAAASNALPTTPSSTPSSFMPLASNDVGSGNTATSNVPASVAAAPADSTVSADPDPAVVPPQKDSGSALAKPSKPASSRPGAPRGSKHSAVSTKLTAEPPAKVPAAESASAPTVANNSTEPATGDYVAPRLLKAVKPVTPPDVMRNYVTGNVNVDALVDSTGHIKSVKALSGPLKLRSTAVQQMKQYLYAPARRAGKPVESHVQVSLQFWYEP